MINSDRVAALRNLFFSLLIKVEVKNINIVEINNIEYKNIDCFLSKSEDSKNIFGSL